MSKAIVIKKNGVSQNLTVDKLRTNGADGQSIDWVPEDTVQLVALNATANGTYTQTGGKYGFEYATVSVPGSVVTGIKPDGNTYVYTKDGNGALVETKVPTEIRITTLPNVLTYGGGATLGFDGIEVTAYYGDGSAYGVIPFEQLIFPVTQAPWEPAEATYHATSDECTEPIACGTYLHIVYTNEDTNDIFWESGTGKVAAYVDGQWVRYLYASDDPNAVFSGSMDSSYTHNGKTVYYDRASYSWQYHTVDYTIPDGTGWSPDDERAAWAMIYGNITSEGGYQVPVQWQRPGDGLTLETSYGISIIPPPSGTND